MSYANIIEGLLQQGTSPQSHQRMRNGAEYADRTGGTGGIQDILGSLLGGGVGQPGSAGAGSSGGFAEMARDFLTKPQAGGMSGGQLGGLGALAGAFLGRGVGGAAKGGAMAILGTLALNAWREYQAQSAGAAGTAQTAGQPGASATVRAGGTASTGQGTGQPGAAPRTIPEPPRLQPTPDQVKALTDPQTERLVMRAMIGAAQVDGRVTGAELDKILGHMGDGDVTEEERRAAYAEISRPVDLAALGREVTRPEVAMQVYLAALMSVDIDTDSERDYFRRLASAMRLDPGITERLHRMTGAPTV